MSTNTVVLIVVAIAAALVLAGVVVVVGYKFRAERRVLGGNGILDEAEEDMRLADEIAAAKARATQVNREIKAFRSRGRRTESADAKQAADMRAQLNDRD